MRALNGNPLKRKECDAAGTPGEVPEALFPGPSVSEIALFNR